MMHLLFLFVLCLQLVTSTDIQGQDGPPTSVHIKPTVPFNKALVVFYEIPPSTGRYNFFIDDQEIHERRTEQDAICYTSNEWISSIIMRNHNTNVRFGCRLWNGLDCDSSCYQSLSLNQTCGDLRKFGWDKITRSFKCWDITNFHSDNATGTHNATGAKLRYRHPKVKKASIMTQHR